VIAAITIAAICESGNDRSAIASCERPALIPAVDAQQHTISGTAIRPRAAGIDRQRMP
jgi:hypothetical protein